jgi:PAS domain S-box-containing protein
MKPMPDYSPPPALLEAIIRSATDYAIITVDASRRVTSWNPGASVLLGWDPAEIVGQSGDLIFTPEVAREMHPAWKYAKLKCKVGPRMSGGM